jgi:hypothetical protein
MIRLNMSAEPQVIDLGFGVSVTVRPLTSSVVAMARADKAVPPIGDMSVEVYTVEIVKAIGRLTITDWDGVGDLEGNPVEPTPDWINRLLSNWKIYEAFNDKFVSKALMLREEGNGSAPSPTGISAGA